MPDSRKETDEMCYTREKEEQTGKLVYFHTLIGATGVRFLHFLTILVYLAFDPLILNLVVLFLMIVWKLMVTRILSG